MQNDSNPARPEIAIGAPVYHPAYSKRGHVVEIKTPSTATFTIGGSGLQRDRLELVIVWDDDTISEVSENVADTWLDNYRRYNLPPIDNAAERLATARAKEAERREARRFEAEQRAEARTAFEADAAPRIPGWAQAVILAELVADQSDGMSDYYGSTTIRSVILAFSRHTRDLFPEMRKAAGNFAETADLAVAPPDAEHREKWSMGAGYYLKLGGRHSSGWRIVKRSLRQNGEAVKDLPTGEWAAPDAKPEKSPASSRNAPRFTIEEHMHTKMGIPIFLCVLDERVERAEFDAFRDRAREHGGWYSRPWRGTPGGFAFKDRASAERFAASETTDDEDGTDPEPEPVPAIAAKLRRLADDMQHAINRSLAERRTNTPKRQFYAALARIDGQRLSRTQAALRALADAHIAGTVPTELADIASKSQVYDRMGTVFDRSSAGYYDVGIDTGEPQCDDLTARALWRLIGDRNAADPAAEILKQKIDKIRFARIPGFVLTPPAVADELVGLAMLPDSSFDLLDPRAGTGVIVDRVRNVAPTAVLTIFEPNDRLREILELKGYEIAGAEFMKADPRLRFDRVLMNPPFEHAQDIDHVRLAFSMLRPGGRLVSVMSPTSFTRQDRKALEFQKWFDELGGEKIDLPPKSFRESGTDVSTVIVILNARPPTI